MKIPSSHCRRRSLLLHTAPQSLAKTIARDETNMSTFECTRNPSGMESLEGLMHNNMVGGSKGSLLIYEKHFSPQKRYLYIFVEKGKIFEKKF